MTEKTESQRMFYHPSPFQFTLDYHLFLIDVAKAEWPLYIGSRRQLFFSIIELLELWIASIDDCFVRYNYYSLFIRRPCCGFYSLITTYSSQSIKNCGVCNALYVFTLLTNNGSNGLQLLMATPEEIANELGKVEL